MLEEQMSALVHAEMSVLVDILYHPEVLFHASAPVHHGFSSGGFMTKYGQPFFSVIFVAIFSRL